MVRASGRYYVAFIAGFVGLTGLTLYFTMVQPMINPEPYKRIRERALSKPTNS